jgi:hypothetical protein
MVKRVGPSLRILGILDSRGKDLDFYRYDLFGVKPNTLIPSFSPGTLSCFIQNGFGYFHILQDMFLQSYRPNPSLSQRMWHRAPLSKISTTPLDFTADEILDVGHL